jgi:hypothetical protein
LQLQPKIPIWKRSRRLLGPKPTISSAKTTDMSKNQSAARELTLPQKPKNELLRSPKTSHEDQAAGKRNTRLKNILRSAGLWAFFKGG